MVERSEQVSILACSGCLCLEVLTASMRGRALRAGQYLGSLRLSVFGGFNSFHAW